MPNITFEKWSTRFLLHIIFCEKISNFINSTGIIMTHDSRSEYKYKHEQTRNREDQQTNNVVAQKWWKTINSTNNLWAGGPSIIMLIQRICMGLRGEGMFQKVVKAIIISAETDLKAQRAMSYFRGITWCFYKIVSVYVKFTQNTTSNILPLMIHIF